MSPGGKRAIVLLGLMALSCIVCWLLMAMEIKLAPMPKGLDEAALNNGLDNLIASMWRWQLIYLPVLGLTMSLGAAVFLDGPGAWLDAVVAMLFILAMVVMVQSTTVNWTNSAIVAVAYAIVGGLLAQVVRKKRAHGKE